jgi:ribosomal-protein-alanine N-acetyltransferase
MKRNHRFGEGSVDEESDILGEGAIEAGQLILDTLRVEDVPALMLIEERSFSAPWSEATYRHEVSANPMAFYYVIRPPVANAKILPEGSSGNETLNTDALITSPISATPPNTAILAYGGFWLTGDEAHIVTIASHHELRGLGLGETMLLFLLQQAQSLGVSIVSLEVRPSNAPALGLYRKWGFEEEGRRKDYYRDNHEDALIYTLRGLENPMTFLPIVLALGMRVTSIELPNP